MPFGGILSIAGPLIGIGSSIAGLASGPPSSHVQGYDYAYRPQADQAAWGGMNQLTQLGNQGVYAAQNIQNNPYIQSYLQGIGQTGQQGMQSGQALTQAGLGALPDVQALLNLGFDPQQALYAKLQNQNQQQNAAILGQSGVSGTPYGGGVAADANSNFNINWQNQQLQRATQAAGAAGGLLGNIGGATSTGLQQMQTGAGLPYNAYTGINTDALSALAQAGGITQSSVGDYLSYLGGGTSQQGANLNQANSVFSQNQALGSGLGQSLAGLSKGWGNLSGGWGRGGGGNPFNITGSLY